jgi:hypothetical protein
MNKEAGHIMATNSVWRSSTWRSKHDNKGEEFCIRLILARGAVNAAPSSFLGWKNFLPFCQGQKCSLMSNSISTKNGIFIQMQ